MGGGGRSMLGTRCLGRKGSATVLGLLVLAWSVVCTGCYWMRYEALAETHLELLTSYADKLLAEVEHGRGPAPGDWPEFTYPGDRAADFARIVAGRFQGRESMRELRATIVIYQNMTRGPEAVAGRDALARLRQERQALGRAAARTRAALARED